MYYSLNLLNINFEQNNFKKRYTAHLDFLNEFVVSWRVHDRIVDLHLLEDLLFFVLYSLKQFLYFVKSSDVMFECQRKWTSVCNNQSRKINK